MEILPLTECISQLIQPSENATHWLIWIAVLSGDWKVNIQVLAGLVSQETFPPGL